MLSDAASVVSKRSRCRLDLHAAERVSYGFDHGSATASRDDRNSRSSCREDLHIRHRRLFLLDLAQSQDIFALARLMLLFRAFGLLFFLRFPELLPAERDLCPSVSDSALSASAAFASGSVLSASAASASVSALSVSSAFDSCKMQYHPAADSASAVSLRRHLTPVRRVGL